MSTKEQTVKHLQEHCVRSDKFHCMIYLGYTETSVQALAEQVLNFYNKIKLNTNGEKKSAGINPVNKYCLCIQCFSSISECELTLFK